MHKDPFIAKQLQSRVSSLPFRPIGFLAFLIGLALLALEILLGKDLLISNAKKAEPDFFSFLGLLTLGVFLAHARVKNTFEFQASESPFPATVDFALTLLFLLMAVLFTVVSLSRGANFVDGEAIVSALLLSLLGYGVGARARDKSKNPGAA